MYVLGFLSKQRCVCRVLTASAADVNEFNECLNPPLVKHEVPEQYLGALASSASFQEGAPGLTKESLNQFLLVLILTRSTQQIEPQATGMSYMQLMKHFRLGFYQR